MKKFIVFLLIVGALYMAGKSGMNLGLVGNWMGLGGGAPGQGGDARSTSDPVYAEIRLRAEVHDRTFNLVILGKAFDQTDCQAISKDLLDRMQTRQNQGGPFEWQLVSSECKQVLDSRDARLFDNKPTFVNYLSASPGASTERETRMVFWGVTAQEGDKICGLIPQWQERWKGALTCIHALPSQ
jgi:hypothetical protein